MIAEFTPGPWAVRSSKEGCAYVESPVRSDPRIAYVYGQFTECPYEEQEANARLIAAAPELLEACIHARSVLLGINDALSRVVPPIDDALAILNATIKKAEGAQ